MRRCITTREEVREWQNQVEVVEAVEVGKVVVTVEVVVLAASPVQRETLLVKAEIMPRQDASD